MDRRKMTEPALPDRRPGPSRPWAAVTRRVAPVAAVAAAAVMLGVLPAAGAPSAPDARPLPAAGQDSPVPGTDPSVQKWFKAREGLQIELNNALLPAQHLPRPASAARPICTRLLRAAGALAVLSRVPSLPLQEPVRAGLDTFVQAATTCLAGDLPKAEQLVAQGLAARAAVSEQIDEILDGD
jgi:hypothetical protein